MRTWKNGTLGGLVSVLALGCSGSDPSLFGDVGEGGGASSSSDGSTAAGPTTNGSTTTGPTTSSSGSSGDGGAGSSAGGAGQGGFGQGGNGQASSGQGGESQGGFGQGGNGQASSGQGGFGQGGESQASSGQASSGSGQGGGVPDGWTCNPGYYGDAAGCDCNCGAYDIDCDDPEENVLGCSGALTCDPDGTCPDPAGWGCAPGTFGDGVQCDCECGDQDVDCNDDELPVVGCEAGATCEDGECRTVPPGWTCNPDYYASDPYCDCDCGAYDPDCDVPANPVYGCAAGEGCTAAGTCGAPAGWTCADAAYDDGAICDCECGAGDPDCAGGALPVPACGASEVCIAGTCILPTGNDTCATAAALTEGAVLGTWAGATANYNPGSAGCTGYSAAGADVVYSVALTAGQMLTVSIAGAPADPSLYLVTDCANVGPSCVEGADASGGGNETLVYTATGSESLFLIVDQFGTSDFVPFSLQVSITP